MAHGLKRCRLGMIACALALGAGATPACAQSLGDPMKPPALVIASPAAGDREADIEREPVLQSTLLSKGRHIAMIDGKPLGVGGRIGAATIVAIGPASVTLREGGSTRVLHMYRGVDISNHGASPARSKGRKEGSR